MSDYKIIDWIVVILITLTPYIILWVISKHKKKKLQNDNLYAIENGNLEDFSQKSEKLISKNIKVQEIKDIPKDDSYIETKNVIYRTDRTTITNNEIQQLIQIGYQEAFKTKSQLNNTKSYRTEREDDLCIQFMMNHEIDIQKHTARFEECYKQAFAESDLNKKIELLEQTIMLFKKSKNWFYRTKGGAIYFQDYYEHQHNSNCDDFSYLDSVKDYLDYCINKRDYIIPQIINVISSQNGILQKDIYQYIPDVSRSEIQKTIKELECNNKINRKKKGNSYLLTVL